MSHVIGPLRQIELLPLGSVEKFEYSLLTGHSHVDRLRARGLCQVQVKLEMTVDRDGDINTQLSRTSHRVLPAGQHEQRLLPPQPHQHQQSPGLDPVYHQSGLQWEESEDLTRQRPD